MSKRAKPGKLDRPIFADAVLASYKPEQTDTMRESFTTNTEIALRIREALRRLVWPANYFIANTREIIDRLGSAIEREGSFAFDTETTGTNAWKHKLLCCSFWVGNEGYVVPLEHHLMTVASLADFRRLAPYFADPAIQRINHKIRFDIHFIEQQAGMKVGPSYCDTLVQAQVINPDTQFSKALKSLCANYGLTMDSGNYKQQFGNTAWSCIEPKLACYYAIKDTELVVKLKAIQDRILEGKPRLKALLWDTEMPLYNRVIVPAEAHGMRVDPEYIESILKPTVAEGLAAATEACRPYIEPYLQHAMGPNDEDIPTVSDVLSSPSKLARVAFGKLDVPQIKHITLKQDDRGDFSKLSLDKEAVAALRKTVPFVGLVSDWRKWDTTRKLFTDKLDRWVVDDHVHPDMNLIVSTGRMSMSDPNLQQIPSRMGSLVRAAFIPEDGNVFLSCDFSSQEMRWLASYSQDPGLLRFFHDPTALDPYSETALMACNDPTFDKEAFRKMPKDERKKHRIYAMFKALVLGLGFEMGPARYARTTGLSFAEGKANFVAYYKAFPRVKVYQDEAHKFARKHGFIRTALGRERPLPFINSTESGLRAAAERASSNVPIQGSSADQVKRAALAVQDVIDSCEWPARIALMIHDELLIEVNEAWARANPDCIRDIVYAMETALPLRNVPMVCSASYEKRWGQSMDIDDLDETLDDIEDMSAA